MNCRIMAVAVAMALPAPAWAGGALELLAQMSGLTERKVNMVLGARTSFAEYPYTYARAAEKLDAAIGRANHQRLLEGKSIVLHHEGRRHVVSLSADTVELPVL